MIFSSYFVCLNIIPAHLIRYFNAGHSSLAHIYLFLTSKPCMGKLRAGYFVLVMTPLWILLINCLLLP